jgi:ABC-2 type transport system ATP-binding protein
VIGNLRALGKTILLTTHQLEEAERLCDRVAILAGGGIAMTGTPRSLARQAGAPTRISFSVPEQVRPDARRLPRDLGLNVSGGLATASTADAPAALRVRLEQRAFWRTRSSLR